MFKEDITTPEVLSRHIDIDVPALTRVTQVYPMRINQYFLHLMIKKGAPLIKQVIPDPIELEDKVGLIDPLAEEQNSPTPHLVHRYPDRVLFLVSNKCPVLCRFCTRKRRIGLCEEIRDCEIRDGLRYISKHREVRDVLLSGGDPFLLSDDRLKEILSKLKEIPHVEIIRIVTRVT